MKKSYTTTVEFRASGNLVALEGNLSSLTTRDYQRLVKQAMMETIVIATRQHFLASLPASLKMLVDGAKLPTPRTLSIETRAKLERSMQRLDKAKLDGTPSKIDAAKRSAKRWRERAEKELLPTKQRTGRFANASREMVQRSMLVYQRMTELQNVNMPGNAAVGMGSIEKLDTVETPTANRGGITKSDMKILWRHLEYGTGIFAADKSVNSASKFKAPGGGGAWWWGPARNEGRVVLGSPAMSIRWKTEKNEKDIGERVSELLIAALLA